MDELQEAYDKYKMAKLYLVIPVSFMLGIGLILSVIIGNKKPVTFNDLYPGILAILAGFLLLGLIYWAKRMSKPEFAMSKIEQAIYCGEAIHSISSVQLKSDSIKMIIHPLKRPKELTSVIFNEVNIQSIIESDAENKNKFPLPIIKFDCLELASEKWEFFLLTKSIKYQFEANWPKIIQLDAI